MGFDDWLKSQMKKQGYLNTRAGHEHKPSISAFCEAMEETYGIAFPHHYVVKICNGTRDLSAVEARQMARLLKVETDELIDRFEKGRK